MYIDDSEIDKFISGVLPAMHTASMRVADEPCPRCGHPIRFPIVARKCDVDMFKHLLTAVMDVSASRVEMLNFLLDVKKRAILNASKKE